MGARPRPCSTEVRCRWRLARCRGAIQTDSHYPKPLIPKFLRAKARMILLPRGKCSTNFAMGVRSLITCGTTTVLCEDTDCHRPAATGRPTGGGLRASAGLGFLIVRTGIDVRFFTGRVPALWLTPEPDEIRLDCDDFYAERKQKVKAIFQ
jgi:hypothetical protein